MVCECAAVKDPVVDMARNQFAQELTHMVEIVTRTARVDILVAQPRDVFKLPTGKLRLALSEHRPLKDLLVRSALGVCFYVKLLKRRPVAKQAMTAIAARKAVLEQ